MTIPDSYWQIASVILFLAAGGCSKGTPLPKSDEAKQEAPVLSPVQTQVAELRSKVTKWQENRQKLNTLLASLDKDRKDMLGKLDAFSKSGKPEAEIAPEVKILSTELQEINRQSATYKAKQRDYDLAILKSESKLRSIERQLAASDAGVSETDISELTRTMLALDDNLNAQDTVSSVVTELDDSVAKQLAEYRASKDAEVSRLQDQLRKQAEMAASKATVIVTVTPPDAKVLVTGNGVTITGSGGSRVVTIDNPIGEYRLIATMDGYKPLDMELQPEKGEARSLAVSLDSMQPVVSTVAPSDEFISTGKNDAENSPPTDATLFQGHYYKVFKEAGLDWKAAKKRCEEIGGHLVTITNEQENKFIAALAAKTLGDINNSGIWLGASDERNEGRWEWIDGTPFKYSAWFGDQPNGKESENFLLLLLSFRGQDGKEIRGWCDQPQAGKHHVIYYACEWDDPENKLGSPDKSSSAKAEAFDPFKQKSVWTNSGIKLTVIDRRDGTFRAKLECSEWARIVKGTVKDGQVSWLAKDVQPIKGGKGGDNFGTISRDENGYRMDVDWKQSNGESGTGTYRLNK